MEDELAIDLLKRARGGNGEKKTWRLPKVGRINGEIRKVAIVGTPNSGKSLLFRRMTGKYSVSSNYPYSTSQIERAYVEIEGKKYLFYDTLGIEGVDEEEGERTCATRGFIEDEIPDVIVQCAEASNLERSLVLTRTLEEYKIPIVLCLNMMDEVIQQGKFIDTERLSNELMLPVVPICATDGRGVSNVRAQIEIAGKGGNGNGGVGKVMTVEDSGAWAQKVAESVVKPIGLGPKTTALEVLSKMALDRFGSWVCLLTTMATLYIAVVELGAKRLTPLLDQRLIAPMMSALEARLGEGATAEILVGQFGIISMGVANIIATVIPIVTIYYLFFALLEDIGYFPILTVQFDRIMRIVGLNGRAVLPMTLGFGCNAVALMATRFLETRRQQFLAAALIAMGTPCAVQLGVIVAIISTQTVVVALGIVAVIATIKLTAGIAMARLSGERDEKDLIIEIPRLRSPSIRNVVIKTYYRMVEFMKDTAPIFLASAAILSVLKVTGGIGKIREAMTPLVERALGLPVEFSDALMISLARKEVGVLVVRDLLEGGRLTESQLFAAIIVLIVFLPCLTTTITLAKCVGIRRAAILIVTMPTLAVIAGAIIRQIWV